MPLCVTAIKFAMRMIAYVGTLFKRYEAKFTIVRLLEFYRHVKTEIQDFQASSVSENSCS